MERSTQRIKEKATWFSKENPDVLWDLFIWLNPGPWMAGRGFETSAVVMLLRVLLMVA